MQTTIKCTPFADERECKFRSVLDGEEWCDTHDAWRWVPWQWRKWEKRAASGETETDLQRPAMEQIAELNDWLAEHQPDVYWNTGLGHLDTAQTIIVLLNTL